MFQGVFTFKYTMKIKEQTRKLTAGYSKYGFEVVDKTKRTCFEECKKILVN